jgi:hypothetical protein
MSDGKGEAASAARKLLLPGALLMAIGTQLLPALMLVDLCLPSFL